MFLYKKAFTLLELLIAISIIMAVLFMSFNFFIKFGQKDALEKDKAGLISLMRNARLLSVASKDATAFGVHLESSKAVLFQGGTYVAGGANEKVMEFSKYVVMSGYALSQGTADIVFSRLTGNISNYGNITLSLTDNSTSTMITILQTGVVQ